MLVVKIIMDWFVFVGCIGFYLLVGCLYDMFEIMMFIYINLEVVNLLLKKCLDFIFCYCMVLKVIGVNGVVMVELVVGFLFDEDCM